MKGDITRASILLFFVGLDCRHHHGRLEPGGNRVYVTLPHVFFFLSLCSVFLRFHRLMARDSFLDLNDLYHYHSDCIGFRLSSCSVLCFTLLQSLLSRNLYFLYAMSPPCNRNNRGLTLNNVGCIIDARFPDDRLDQGDTYFRLGEFSSNIQ